MPRNAPVVVPINTWTQITANDITTLRVQILEGKSTYLLATVGAVPPSSLDGAIAMAPGQILAANLLLSELFPGVSGANRVYAFCPTQGGSTLSVSHA